MALNSSAAVLANILSLKTSPIMNILQSAILEKNSCTDYCTTDKNRDSESSGREGEKMEEEGGIYRAWYRTATGNTSSAPALPSWYRSSTTTQRTMDSPRGRVSPSCSSQTAFSNHLKHPTVGACYVMSKQFSRKFKTMTAQKCNIWVQHFSFY